VFYGYEDNIMSLRVVGNTGYGSNQRDLVSEITEKVPSYVQIEQDMVVIKEI
jgi:hypothetical protein